MPTVASASVFGGDITTGQSAAQYRKNQLYNLRATVGNGATIYGTFTQSILVRPIALPAGVNDDAAEKLNIDGLDSANVTPVASGNVQPVEIKTQDVTFNNDESTGNNPLLINSHANFEPAQSFGGLGYNLKTEVKNGSTLYATNRLALLSNPFAAIFGNVFAGECTKDTSDPTGKSCRKLNFGQKGVGTTENNFGGANFSYQIPGYFIQSDSILKWDENNDYGNGTMAGVITDLEHTAFRRDCPVVNKPYTFNNLSFTKVTNEPLNCSVGLLSDTGNGGSGVAVIKGDFNLNGPSNGNDIVLRGVGTFIIRGNLNINRNITYDNANSSVGFIVLGKDEDEDGEHGGTITIAGGVTKAQGMFYAPGKAGKIVISPSSSKLVVKGIFATAAFELNKRTGIVTNTPASVPDKENLDSVGITNTNTNTNYNVAILYDPRIQSNPPPGFKYGITSISSSDQSLFEPAAP
jgi:hypothetical protein